MLNKYRGPNDESFKTVSSCLKELVNNTEDRLITQGRNLFPLIVSLRLLTYIRDHDPFYK